MSFFFFNDTATTEIYTLSLHDALPIFEAQLQPRPGEEVGRAGDEPGVGRHVVVVEDVGDHRPADLRSEEHTSELQSRQYLVCRLLLEKKKTSLLSLLLFLRPRPLLP